MAENIEGWKEVGLRYGDIIAVKMSGSSYFLGSNGLSECEVELRDLYYSEGKSHSVRPYESLFRVLPIQYSSTMAECIAFNSQSDQSKRTQLLTELENEQNANTQRSNSHWGTTVLINQSITLEHVLSRKFLTLKPSNISANSYNLQLETAGNEEIALTFSPFFSHKLHKNDSVLFADKLTLSAASLRDVSLCLHCSVKLCFEIENILRHSNIQVGVQKEIRRAPNNVPAQDIQFSLDNSTVTPFELVKFRDCDYHELSEEIPAGSVCLLFHLETGTAVREESMNTSKHHEDKNQILPHLKDATSSKGVKYSLKYQESPRDSQCLWIIEKLNLLEGGNLNYKNLIRLQNLRSGAFLSFGRNAPPTEGAQEGPFSNDIFQIMNERGIERTLEENLCCGDSFCLYHPFSDKFVDIEFEHVSCTYQLRLESSAVKVQSFKLAKLDELLCWEIQFVQACKDTLGRSLSEIQSVLGKESGGAWQISITAFEQIAKAIGAIDRLLRFIRSSGFFLEDIFLEETQNSQGSNPNPSGGKNSAKIRRIEIMIAHSMHALLFDLLSKILSNPFTFQKLRVLGEAIKDPEENPYNTIFEKKQEAPNLEVDKASNNPGTQQLNKKKIPPVATPNPSDEAQLVNFSWEMELGKGLAMCINQIFDLLTQMVAQDSFPENALRSSIIKCIVYMGVGNSWKCLGELLKKYRYADIVITSADISIKKSEFKLFENLNLIQAISSKYIRTYDSEDKYSLDFVEFLIEICRDAPPDIKAKNQILIGKVLCEELSDLEIERVLILLYTVRKDQSPVKALFVNNVGQKLDFLKFARLTNNNTRGREMNLLLHKIKLKTVLCENRNYYNIYALRDRFPYYLLLEVIKNEDLNQIIRSIFLEFYVHLYLNVDPFYTNFPTQTIVFNRESLQIGSAKANNFLNRGKKNTIFHLNHSQKNIHKTSFSQGISKHSFADSDPIDKEARRQELDSHPQQYQFSEQLIQPSLFQIEKAKYDQKKVEQQQPIKIIKEKRIPLVLEAKNILETESTSPRLFTQPEDVKENAKFLTDRNAEKQFVGIEVSSQDDISSHRQILHDNQKISDDQHQEIEIVEEEDEDKEIENSMNLKSGLTSPKQQITLPKEFIIGNYHKFKKNSKLFRKLSQKNLTDQGLDIFDGKQGEVDSIQEAADQESQSEDERKRKDEELCHELEYRSGDWLNQIKIHVLLKIDSFTISTNKNQGISQFTTIQLRYLYAILQAFKLLITMGLCSVEHNTLKNLLKLLEINTSGVKAFPIENAPFIQLKQRSKTLVKELDFQWLADKIKEEVMDIYLYMMERQKEEKIQTIIGFMSSKIETISQFESKINFSNGKLKVLVNLKEQQESLKKTQPIGEVIDIQQKTKSAIDEENSIIHQIKKDEKIKNQKEIIRQYDESIAKCESAIDSIIKGSLLELLKLPEIGGGQYLEQDTASNYSMGLDVTNAILACLEMLQQNQQPLGPSSSSCIRKMLQLLGEIAYQPSQLISALQSKQILLRQEDIDKYEVLRALCEVLCSYQERRFILWLSDDQEERSSLLQVINVVMFKSSQHLSDANRRLEKCFKEEDYLYKIQQMIYSLNIHHYAIQLLQDVYTGALDPLNTSMLSETLTAVFNFLILFAKDNVQTQHILKNYRTVFCKYLDCPEFGQTSFFATVFLLSPQMPPPTNALSEFLQCLRGKREFSKQINPEDLNILFQVLQKRPDMESRLFSEIFDSTLIYSFFGMLDLLPEQKDEQDEDEQKQQQQQSHLQAKEQQQMKHLNLDQQQKLLFQSIVADLDMQTDRKKRKLSFEIDMNMKERCPYIYQAYALRTIRDIFGQIQGKQKMADQLKLIFSTSYLFELLAQEDYFTRKNEHLKQNQQHQQSVMQQSPKSINAEEGFLRIILKIELASTLRTLWLERLSYPLDIIRNNYVLRFLEYVIRLLQNYSKTVSDNFDLEIAQIRGFKGQTLSPFQSFVQQYLQNLAPKETKLPFEEPLGEITYIFKHLLPFLTDLKNVFDLLRKSHWYPPELPHPELRLMKKIGEKFEEVFFQKSNSCTQNDLREVFHNEIIKFSKVYCTRNPFLESTMENQSQNNNPELDTPLPRNSNGNRNAIQFDHIVLPISQIQSKLVMLSPISDSPLDRESSNLVSFTNMSNNYFSNSNTPNHNKTNNLNPNGNSPNSNNHKRSNSKPNPSPPAIKIQTKENNTMTISKKSEESQRKNMEVSAMLPQPTIQMTNIFNFKLQFPAISSNITNKKPMISQVQQAALPSKKQILLQIEFSAHLVGMNLPEMRNLLSIRRQEQYCNTYRRLFLHVVSSQAIRKQIVLPQSAFIFNSIFSDICVNSQPSDIMFSSFSTAPITSNTKSFFFCRQICSRLTYYLNQLPQEDPTKLILLDPVFSSAEMLIELLSYLPHANRKSIQQVIHFECLKGILQSSRFFSSRRYLSIFLKLFSSVYTTDASQSVIDDLFLIFDTQPSIEYFFTAISSVIQEQLNQSSQILHNQQRIFHLINSLPNCSFEKYSFHLFHDISLFIQLLNSHTSHSFTKFWRKQVSSTKSYDLMAMYIRLFDVLLKNTILFGSTQTNFGYSIFYHELTVDCLVALLSMIKKDESVNKDYLMRSSFLDNMSQLWETPKTTGLKKENQTSDMKMQYFLATQGMKLSERYFDNAFLFDNVIIIKTYMMEIFEHLIEGDFNGERKQQIVRKLSFSNLQKYLQAFYKEFKDAYGGYYSHKAHSFIKYGFNIFLLLEQEKESQKVIQQSLSTQEQNENAKLFAQAYEFFHRNSGQIDILINSNTLVNVHFLYFPHSLASTPEIEQSILQKITRLPEQQKRKQFFLSAEEYDVRLKIEQDLRDKAQNGKILIKILQFSFKHLNKLKYLNFGIAFADNLYLLLKYQDISGSSYFDKTRDGSLDDFITATLGCLFVVNLLILIFSILQTSKYLSWKSASDIKKEIQIEEEEKIEKQRKKSQKQRDYLLNEEKKTNEKNARDQEKLDKKIQTERDNLLQEKKKQYDLMRKKEKGNTLVARQNQQYQQQSLQEYQKQQQIMQSPSDLKKQENINQDTQETSSQKQEKASQKLDVSSFNNEKPEQEKDTQKKLFSNRRNSTKELTSISQFYKSHRIQLKPKQQQQNSSSSSFNRPVRQRSIKYNQGILNIMQQIYRTLRISFMNIISQKDLSYVVLYTPILFFTLFFNEFFAALLLFDVFAKFPETKMIITVLYRLKTKILSSILLFFILVYFFALAGYLFAPIQMLYGNYCTNLYSCFSVILDSTLRSFVTTPPIYDNIYDTYDDKFQLGYEDIYLFLYAFFVVSLVWTWIFTAFFVDSYSQLRKEHEEQQANSTKTCLVCGLDRKQIESSSPQDFDYHITVHNPWEYLKYISILLTKPANELTTIEKQVFESWKNSDISWIQTGQLKSKQQQESQTQYQQSDTS